jgi:hypothetical protein
LNYHSNAAFLYNSISEDLKTSLCLKLEPKERDDFICVWIRLLEKLTSVSSTHYETLKNKIRNCKPNQFEHENIEKYYEHIVPSLDDLISSNEYDHSLSEVILSNISSGCSDHSQLRHMPLDLDNGLPGILVRLGTTNTNEISIHTHINTCAAMSTGNLLVHQWFITTYPQCVAEYIQYDDSNPFEPIKLSCAIEDLTAAEALDGKLTV